MSTKRDGRAAMSPSVVLTFIAFIIYSTVNRCTILPMKDTARLVPIKKSRSPLNLILLLGIVALGTAVAMKYHRSNSFGGFIVRDHAVKAEVSSFSVTWRSKRPYPSVIKLLSPVERVVQGEDKKATRKHKVVLRDLTPNEHYSYAILYPNGETSLPQTVRTKSMELILLKGEKLPTGGHSIYFKTIPTSSDRQANGIRGSDNTALQIIPCADDVYALNLPGKIKFDSLTLDVTLAGSAKTSFSLSSLLESEIVLLTNELNSFNRAKVMAPTEREMTKAIEDTFQAVTGKDNVLAKSRDEQYEDKLHHQKKLQAITKALEERLQVEPCYSAYERACALSPLYLDGELVPLQARLHFHEKLRRFEDVFLYMALRHMHLKFPRPNWGEFSLSRKPPKTRGKDIALYKDFKKPLLLGSRVMFSENVVGKKEFFIDLEEVPKGRAIACLTVRSFYDQAIRLTVNDKVDFTLCDGPIHSKKSEMFTFFQSFPASLLKKGKNRIRLFCDISVGRVATRGIAILRLALHFPPE